MRASLAANFIASALAGCTILSDKCYDDKHTESHHGVLQKSHDITKLEREYCAQVCANEGYKLAGVEFGQQCWCGMHIADYAQERDGCNMACSGNAGQICGGFDAINVMTFHCEYPPEPSPGGASEPYPPLSSFNSTALPPRNSPDPLVRYKWDDSVDQSKLQRYHARPVKVTPIPASSFLNVESLLTDSPNVTVLGAGRLELDFGVERAAWLEFNSSDLGPQYGAVKASISEYAYPWQDKTQKVSAYGDVYRLEPNNQLYEGVRFAWIFFEPEQDAAVEPWHLTDVRAVAWVRPVSYHGAFSSDDAQLERVWYEGAYGVRLNMNAEDFGSILMERGDRVSIQGDGHPTMAAALAAFGPDAFDLVRIMLGKTDSGCDGCHVVDDSLMSYPILWTMSVNDYFWASGDVATLAKLAPDMQNILDNSIKSFLQEPPVAFMGWDDRLDNGFCGTGAQGTPEVQFAFATLAARAVHDFAQAVAQIPAEIWSSAAAVATRYNKSAADMCGQLRAKTGPGGAPYYEAYGLHAAANAVNVPGLATADEAAAMLSRVMNDSTTACSWSPFNQYWNVQALANMGRMDYALANVRLCWGTQLKLMNGCFQELYSPEWAEMFPDGSKLPTRPSQCHPWSSGVTAWMSRSMLGVTPLLPGFERYLAVPYLPLQHVDYVAEGSAATFRMGGSAAAPHGPIAVEAVSSVEAAVRRISVTVDSARPGIVGLRALDEAGCHLRAGSVRMDGEAVAAGPLAETGLLHPLAAALHVFAEVPAGRHAVTAEYVAEGEVCMAALRQLETSAGFPPYPPASHPASVLPLDYKTRGAWQGRYGGDGYLLFNFNSGIDVKKLPSYVRSVAPYKSNHNDKKFYGNNASNATYLEAPAGLSGRALGSIGEGCDDGCQGTVFDVELAEGHEGDYLLSLYMVDTVESPDGDPIDREGQHVIRTMDLETLSPVAPELQSWIKDHEGGVYWTLRYNRGVRLRLMPLFKSAKVSAMFWDRPSRDVAFV